MYTIIVFALALLSPMPFISPFDYGVQDATAQSPFGPFGSDQNLPTDAIAQNTSTIDIVTSVTDLSASITSPVVSGISTSSEIFSIASATINNTPYAIVSYIFGDIVYIINMTNPTSPSYVSDITDTNMVGPNGVVTTTLDGSHYALVASYTSESISIINITNPTSPNVVSTILNTNSTFSKVEDVYISKIGVYTYAVIPSPSNRALSFINITEPEHSKLIYRIGRSDGFSTISGINGVDTIKINNDTYVITIGNNYLEIINITNPISPNLTSTTPSTSFGMNSFDSINAVEIDGLYYVLASSEGDGIQIINITNPTSPSSIYSIEDGAEYSHVGTVDKIITTIVDNYTYALAADRPSRDDVNIQIIDITNPESPNPISVIPVTRSGFVTPVPHITSIIIENSTYVLAASYSNLIHVLKLESIYGELFTITSSNPNNMYSKENDTITIELTVNDTITSSTVKILNQTVQEVVNDNHINESFIVPSDPIEGNLTFEIMVENAQGAILNLTQDDLDDQHIFVDTIRPSITLIGNSSYSLLQFGDINEIPNATASDGSPGYTFDNYTITQSGNLNTSVAGSFVNYTYTADTDAAGNLGESKVRTITIVSLSNNINIENVTVNSTNTNNVSYAKAGDNVTITIVTDVHGFDSITGNILGDATFENTSSSEILYLTKTIQSNDSNINFEFDILLVNDTVGNVRITQENLTGGNIIIDTIPPILTLNGENDTVSLTNQEYIDANATAYDLSYGNITVGATNMVNQTTLGSQTLFYITPLDRAGNPGPNLTRNVIILEPLSIEIANDSFGMSVISAVNITSPEDTDTIMINGSYYAITAGLYGIQITNITNPAFPVSVSNVSLNNLTQVETITIKNSHYALAVKNDSIKIINITNPTSPFVVSEMPSGTINGLSLSITAIDVFTISNTNHYSIISLDSPEINSVIDNRMIKIINITNPVIPDLIYDVSDTEYLNTSTGNIMTIEINNSYYALLSGAGSESVRILNITNPILPDLVYYNFIDAASDTIKVDYLQIGNSHYVLFGSGNSNGFKVINITNLTAPYTISNNYIGNTGSTGTYTHTQIDDSHYAIISDSDDARLHILNITDINNPVTLLNVADDLDGYEKIDDLDDIEVVKINGFSYIVTTSEFDNGLQTIRLGKTPFYNITSNNIDPAYAKKDDTITVHFTTNDTIADHNVTILHETPTTSVLGDYLSASIMVPNIPMEGYPNITISVESIRYSKLVVTESDLPEFTVFVDTIQPSVSLFGNETYPIAQHSQLDQIPGAIVYDGSPGYVSGYDLHKSNTINTSQIGSSAIYTYTAHPDAAGNLGYNVTRNVIVVNSDPIMIRALNAYSGNIANHNYARAGDTVTILLSFEGNLGNVTASILGSYIDNYQLNPSSLVLIKTITQSDANGNLTFNIRGTNSTNNILLATSDNLTGSNIIIDTIAPSITLNGNTNTVSIQNRPYTDANATAYDLSYGNKTVQSTGFVNTSALGIYTLTYTAPDDSAGNLGSSITRNVIIVPPPPIEIASDPFAMSAISAVTITLPEDTDTIMINGSYYAITVNSYGMPITNITNPAFPIRVSHVPLSNLIQVETITIKNSHYALAVKHDSVTIINITNPTSPFVISEIPSETINGSLLSINTIGTLTINNTNHYSIISLASPEINHVVDYRVIKIINITNPKIPDLIYNVSNTEYLDIFTNNIITFEINNSYYAALSGVNTESVRILNVTNPILPDLVYYDLIDGASGTIKVDYLQIGNSHYILHGSANSNGFRVTNITNLTAPYIIGDSFIGKTGDTGTYTHTQIDGSHYAIVSDGEAETLYILNITNIKNAVTLLNAEDGMNGYEKIDDPIDIEIVKINGFSYIVTSSDIDNGLQIIRFGKAPFYNITSNNTDPTYAKKGDIVTVHLTINGTIADHNATILNETPSASVMGAYLNASIMVPDIQMEGYPNITISVENTESSKRVVTERDLPEFAVFIDTIRPNISLIGNETYHIIRYSTLDQIPGAIVYDGDPRYVPGYNLNISNIIDTDQIGSFAIYTYTAHTDAAGNLGYNVTRNVTVIASDPIVIETLTINSDNSVNSSYARAGNTITIDLTVDSTNFGNITASILGETINNYVLSSDELSLNKTITRSDTNGNLTFSIRATNSTGHSFLVTNENLTSPNIIIDTIAPSITLNGKNNTVSIINRSYTDANATAYDLSYGSKTIQPTGFVNTSTLGNYILTYVAPDDYAGHTGPIITRNVIVATPPPIAIQALSIHSTNANNLYAKAGDNITVRLSINDTITAYDVEIFNDTLSPTITNSSNNLNVDITVPNDTTEKYLTFNITVQNEYDVKLSAVPANLSTDSIFVDTISPNITLNGNATYSVLVNTSYTDPGAVSSDGDPNYAKTYVITNNSILNTTLVGSTVIYTYTADSDGAGNLGANITRNVTVVDYNSLNITSLTIVSNNSNNSYAKAGDQVNITIVTDGSDVGNVTGNILGSDNFTQNSSNGTITFSKTITQNDTNGNPTFNIRMTNSSDYAARVTQEDLIGDNIIIDTIAPIISINGNVTTYHLLQNRSTNLIPNATVTDDDPNYNHTYVVTSNITLNTSMVGSSAIYTYTPDPDGAGNMGESVNLTVTVVDYGLLNITGLTVHSNNSNNSYAKAGDQVNITIVTDGSDIKNITGSILGDESFTNHTSNGTITLSKTITQSDTNGNLTFSIHVVNSTDHASRVTQENLIGESIIIDTLPPLIYLYGINNTISDLGSPYVDAGATSYDLSYGIQNVTGTGAVNTSKAGTYYIEYDAPDFAGNPANIIRTVYVQQLAPISLTNVSSQFLVSPTTTVDNSADYPYLGDSYRVTTVEINNSTYALIGTYASDGFTILNITIPEFPTLVFNATGNDKINANIDSPTGISAIQIQNSTYAVIISLDTSRITILNITNPTLPTVESTTTKTDNPNLNKSSAVSTVDINGSAYALMVSQAYSRIVIFNITNPMNLTQVSVLEHGEDYTLEGITNIIPIKMDGSTYILTAVRGNNSVGIIDIGNPKMPRQVALLEDDDDLALESANSIEIISINGRTYALVASPNDNGMQIIDVTHPALPFPVSSVRNSTEYPALGSPHDVTAIKVENSTYALLSSVSDDSIQIIDITNPESPRPASHITHGAEYVQLDRPQTLKAVQINNTAYTLIAARNSSGIQIIQLEHEKTIQSQFSITVNGTSSSYAKAGDTVSVQISINDTIYSYTTQILNLTTYTDFDPNTINASVTIPSESIETDVNFTISIANYLGAMLNLTEDNLTSSNVFVDTISPTIELIGDANYTVLVNTTFSDPGANASDGSPGYNASNYSTIKTGTVNTSDIGSTVNYTYTAYADAAGNPGASINRTVTVIDYKPLNITSLIVSSDNSANNGYVKVGDEITITLVTDGTNLGNATGTILGDNILAQNSPTGTITFSKTITQNDTNGNPTFDIFVTNSSGYAASITQNNLTSSNIIIDTVPPLLYLYGANNTVSHVGSSYVDAGAISYDLSYGIQNVTGTSTVDTSTAGTYDVTYDAPDSAGNPANIIRTVYVQELLQLSLSDESSTLLITPESPIADPAQYPHLTDPFHIETVQIDGSTYALVASNKDSGFTILNMDNPKSPSLVFNATSTQTNYSAIQGIRGASPIQIQDKTYVVTISLTSKILIADITNPESTTFVSERSNGPDYPYLTNMTTISTFSIGDAAYAMIASQSDSWVSILNITEPANPTHLTVLENGANYDLNSPRHIAIIDADGSTFAVITSRNTGTVTILNMDNPEMPVQIHAIKDGINLALSSATGIELVQINTRTYALVASSLDNAMQIIDITHPQLPFPVSTVQKSGTEYTGLTGPHYIAALQVEGATYAFVTSPSTNSTQVIDITNPSQPNPVTVLQNGTEYTHLVTPLYIESVHTDDAAYALVGARGSDGIQIIKLGYEKTIQTPFSITSDGANSSYAKAGDTVSVQITVNGTIDQSKSTLQILNLNANVDTSSLNTINASVTIPAGDIEMYVNVTASITNHLGAMLNLTESNVTDQNVFVDTIPPTITLNGDANYTVLVNSSYMDPKAVASDGDPNYTYNYTITNSGSLNNTVIGSSVNYTYTADPDGAGNPGASINRTVTIVDYDPLSITSFTVHSNNSANSSYAKAGDKITITLVTDGSDVGNATGNILGDETFANSSSGGTIIFSRIITQSDTNGNLTFAIFVTNSSGYAARVTQDDLAISNIIIDTIPPTITLNGNSEDAIEFGSTYTDLGANIADASYESQIIYSSDVVDTFMINTYTLVYTAPNDPAGNLGPSITRTITVSDSTPVMLNSLIINTSNNNPAYAKANDIITVTLIANQTISSANTSIQNLIVTHTIQGNTLSANYTVQNGQQGNPTFEITAYFDSSLPLIVNESNLNSNIFIDTEKPKITLVGSSNITIPINHNYTDSIADVTDNDNLYNGNVSSNASEVNTTKSGTYIIVYSADADGAGNIPDNVTRIVIVSGFVLSISSNNENYDNLAKEGELVTIQLTSHQYINSTITNTTILGRIADNTSVVGSTIYANATVRDSDTNGNITFSIIVESISGQSVNFTHDDLTTANVIVDTIMPEVLSSTTVTPNLISITFDESIVIDSFIDSRTTVTSGSSFTPYLVVVANGSSIPDSVIEIIPSSRNMLSSDATPLIEISTFSSFPSIADLAGNPLPELSITANDGIAPSMQSATVISSDLIEVYFDEQVKFLNDDPSAFFPPPTFNGIPADFPTNISGNTLSIPSSTIPFPTDSALIVFIEAIIITDVAGNFFEADTILTSTADSLIPYTITETTIFIPYMMALNPSTITASDYSVTFGSNPPSAISGVSLSDDLTGVILTMQIPFGTGDTPFVEQIGSISDTFNNDVTMQGAVTQDRAPPILVSGITLGTSTITVTFSEQITSQSTTISHYDVLGSTIRSTGSGLANGTVIVSTSTFVNVAIEVPTSAIISDNFGNIVQGGISQSVIKN